MNDPNKLEDYIDGLLSKENFVEIESLRKSKSDLDFEIDFRSEINEALRDKNFIEFYQIVSSQFETLDSSSKNKFQRDVLKTWHLAAASFSLILVVGGLWYILSNKPISTERLISKYYKPAGPIGQIRSFETSAEDALKEAFNFYQQNDFANALKYFSALDNQITARFYSGVCYIELEQFDKAIESFEFVINDKDNLFVEQAEWYVGLIYLMNNQKGLAIEQFQKISTSQSYYSHQAGEILKYLN
jgi:tetratricopeptide (TPR) repeat protein